MEITFEFEDSDIVVDFSPDFDIAVNCVDIEEVQWNFPHGKNSYSVADVFHKSQDDEISRKYIFPNM